MGYSFWEDATAHEGYCFLGDVVSFGMTYKKTNTISRSIISQVMVTFSPVKFSTDQDFAMKGAMKVPVKNIFPNTLHRYCNWHIYVEVPTYISFYRQNHQFKKL
ncbi:hypothetical protein EJ110_NYTH07496 [Nymphaea thermarum]|nr:hypothetical protein EJ110_NYTH07496 [Nymphaea thermarum]